MSNEYGLPHKDKDIVDRINRSDKELFNFLGNNHSDLSFKSIGILFYLRNQNNGWRFNEKDLYNRFREGKTAVRSGIKELKDAGILREAKWTAADAQGTHWVLEI